MSKKANKKMNKKQKSNKFIGGLLLKYKKITAVIVIVLVALVGFKLLTSTGAAPNNCQKEGTETICDIDQVAGNTDTVLSKSSEAKDLANKGWGVYYGAAFRAPMHAYQGAVPITRINNPKATYHDWVTPVQKSTKETKYKGQTKNEGIAFYAWRTQVKGTVPVYRLTRDGPHTQTIFSTDKAWVDTILARDKNKTNGWKKDHLAPFLAFYAYPPNYKVANQPNPYDCSIKENYLSDRCKTQRENLEKEIKRQEEEKRRKETAKQQQEQIKKREQAAQAAKAVVGSSSMSDKIGEDQCPTIKGDAGLEEYKKGVNELGKKYTKGCHQLWISYAMSKNSSSNKESQGDKQSGPVKSKPAAVDKKCPVYNKDHDTNVMHYANNRAALKPNMSNYCIFLYEAAAKEVYKRRTRFIIAAQLIQNEQQARSRASSILGIGKCSFKNKKVATVWKTEFYVSKDDCEKIWRWWDTTEKNKGHSGYYFPAYTYKRTINPDNYRFKDGIRKDHPKMLKD